MTLEELNPDTALKSLLDGNVKASGKAIKVYEQGEMPNVGVDDDYVTILCYGVITSRTKPPGLYKGNLALSVNCKLNSNSTIKRKLMRKLVGQCCSLIIGRKTSDGFSFSIDPTNVITPPTANLTTGYATTTVNVAWRQDDF